MDQYENTQPIPSPDKQSTGGGLPRIGGRASQLRRTAPFVPYFRWQPEFNDYPVNLIEPSPAGRRRLEETGELHWLPKIEVLSAPRRRMRWVPHAIAVSVVAGSLVAGGAWWMSSSGSNPPGAEPTASLAGAAPTATAEPPTATPGVASPTPDPEQTPGFGGGVPVPTDTAGLTTESPSSTATQEPSATATPTPERGFATVTAEEGDTLVAIANHFDLHVTSVVWSNDIEDPSAPLDAGTEVFVPNVDGVVHRVESGETLRTIADIYGVEPQEILDYPGNRIDDPSSLQIGERIVVPGGTVTDRRSLDDYTVREGDNIWKIASYYGLRPSTIVWANELPQPSLIHPGQELVIPPGNGALIEVEEGDTVEALAGQFNVEPAVVYDYAFNQLQDDSVLQPGDQVLIPGHFLPAIEQGQESPTAESVAGEDAQSPATGSFIWPAQGSISQPFGRGHNGLDIANEEWTPINAVDGGIVVFSGWNEYGLGYAVGIDHGNGMVTWYGHMANQPYVEVGQKVWQGGYLGPMGSTGKSTGPHLHFVVTKDGVYQNPQDYLP